MSEIKPYNELALLGIARVHWY